MFTGIIETTGTVKELISSGANIDCVIQSAIAHELKIDQSVAHNGICLTVVAIDGDTYKVTAVEETISKTNLSNWRNGDMVNLERCLQVGDRLDGHFVQGHIDGTARCIKKENRDGSWLFRFAYERSYAPLVIEKGSICLNGVSLTVFDITDTAFSVTIIPYTFRHTNFSRLQEGDIVNVEFDVLGKYLQRSMQLSG